jgi:hypothetical protein
VAVRRARALARLNAGGVENWRTRARSNCAGTGGCHGCTLRIAADGGTMGHCCGCWNARRHGRRESCPPPPVPRAGRGARGGHWRGRAMLHCHRARGQKERWQSAPQCRGRARGWPAAPGSATERRQAKKSLQSAQKAPKRRAIAVDRAYCSRIELGFGRFCCRRVDHLATANSTPKLRARYGEDAAAVKCYIIALCAARLATLSRGINHRSNGEPTSPPHPLLNETAETARTRGSVTGLQCRP